MTTDPNHDQLNRRDFLRTGGAAGAGAFLAATGLARGEQATQPTTQPTTQPAETQPAATQPAPPAVPTRKFGKTGRVVPMLALGGIFDVVNNQLTLKQALKYGVTYWDTAASYRGGNSELGFGKFFKANPKQRKRIFLVTKSGARDPDGMTGLLEQSLERMNTDYIDLYFIHGLRGPEELERFGRTWKQWAEREKKRGRIKLFGFSTHRNMPASMLRASKAGFIDGIMTTYNFRLMHDDDMKRAVDACHEAGIGLTAMKTQGGGPVKTESEAELALAGKFVQKGYTDKQAKLKAIWENKAIASICSQMPSLTVLMSNIAAAMNQTKLSADEKALMEQYARQTAGDYCAGCADICEGACDGLPVCDVMRYMMYYNDYGDHDTARELFRALPTETRRRLAGETFALAERRCPRHLPITRIMRDAVRTLA